MPSSRGAELVRGAAAGLVGTVAYSALSSRLRPRSSAAGPARPVSVLRSPTSGGGRSSGRRRAVADAALHWAYGGWGGVARALVEHRRVPGLAAELAHLGVVWLPWRLAVAASGKRARPQELTMDLVKHLVYVLVTGAVYRSLRPRAGS